MHEYSIIAALVDRVAREAQGRPGAIVRKLHVRIGELAGVEIAEWLAWLEARRPQHVAGGYAHADGS